MKKLLFSLALIFTSFATFAQAAIGGGASIEFEKEIHDFGNMKQHGDASTIFIFKNTGSEPLIIEDTKGSCGCTVPSKPEEPILPGATGEIKVKYDSKRVGPINKSVTVKSNGSEQPIVLRIKGSIEAAPKEETTPVKAPSETAPVTK